MSAHSTVVGGSSAGRVMACPGSVQLVRKAPPQVENAYMAAGTRLHEAIADLLSDKPVNRRDFDDDENAKLDYALRFIDTLESEEPNYALEYDVEARVKWDEVPGAFGTVDFIGRLGHTAVVLDWKFGDGVMVSAQDNPQLMFYALAALRSNHWAFEGATFVELIIVQPFEVRRWVTDVQRLLDFEADLRSALRLSELEAPPLKIGSHCRFCPAKAICPAQTGEIDRLVKTRLEALNDADLGKALELADMLESFTKAARELVQQKLEAGLPVPGWKLVPKRSTRQWTNEADALAALRAVGAPESELMELRSPAQIEKVLKKRKIALPAEVVTSVSSGDTIAPESDPRPAKVLLAQQMAAALSKI
jgi:CRISPR/Cas system-associated exonuclease Cas4 (RecB family)